MYPLAFRVNTLAFCVRPTPAWYNINIRLNKICYQDLQNWNVNEKSHLTKKAQFLWIDFVDCVLVLFDPVLLLHSEEVESVLGRWRDWVCMVGLFAGDVSCKGHLKQVFYLEKSKRTYKKMHTTQTNSFEASI